MSLEDTRIDQEERPLEGLSGAVRRSSIAWIKPYHYVLGSIVLTQCLVSSSSLFFHGRVTTDYLITGFVASFLVSSVIVGIIHLYQREIEAQNQLLAREKRRSEQLLLNILPLEIARRLMEGEDAIADYYEDVTVLFADIVGFTTLADRTSVVRVVDILNRTFTAFDRIAEKYGLEKIKTIGDAYMVVGGVPTPRDDHHDRVAAMALEMQETIARLSRELDERLELRIGMHSGSVIAGVIGRKKFIYDLWGDTVNTASRMESHGVQGRIHLTADMARQLGERFILEDRGMIDIKGKGSMRTYFLTGRAEGRAFEAGRLSG